MKPLFGKIAYLLMIAFLTVMIVACGADKQPEIAKGIDGCASCQMVIEKVNEACGYFLEKDFKPFCSSGCLLDSYETRRKQGLILPDRIFFADYSGAALLPCDSITFLLTKHIPTVMEWGIIAFAGADEAHSHKRSGDEIIVDWVGLRTLRGVPDRTLSIVFAAGGMIPEVIEVNKGELIDWAIEGRQMDEDLLVTLKGYDELGEILIPASGEIVHIRMLALKPGAGFPFVRSGSGEVLGQIRVSGAHTLEEEEM
jgi:hypothetical protein